jgi:predicted enzyme related to lactoylglutathione lyase
MNEDTGKIGWIDMTVGNAEELRDFYEAVVANVAESAAACAANGGKVLIEPRGLAGGRFCVIEDPGGATAALYQP